jgi:hypothetical protein
MSAAVLAIAIPGGILATLLLIFKPLAIGLLRAALLVLKPRQSLEQRSALSKLRGAIALNRMAREMENIQPNLAAELRMLAGRG